PTKYTFLKGEDLILMSSKFQPHLTFIRVPKVWSKWGEQSGFSALFQQHSTLDRFQFRNLLKYLWVSKNSKNLQGYEKLMVGPTYKILGPMNTCTHHGGGWTGPL
ncbi:hypothetical protein PJP10_31145, partial [Mycobacterium kansasii]